MIPSPKPSQVIHPLEVLAALNVAISGCPLCPCAAIIVVHQEPKS